MSIYGKVRNTSGDASCARLETRRNGGVVKISHRLPVSESPGCYYRLKKIKKIAIMAIAGVLVLWGWQLRATYGIL